MKTKVTRNFSTVDKTSQQWIKENGINTAYKIYTIFNSTANTNTTTNKTINTNSNSNTDTKNSKINQTNNNSNNQNHRNNNQYNIPNAQQGKNKTQTKTDNQMENEITEPKNYRRKLPFKNAKLKIISWNCKSLEGKIETFKLFLESEKPDIMALNKIKLDKPAANKISYVKGYSMVFKCGNSFGGGVELLIRDNIPYEEIKIPDEFTDEIVGIFVKLKCKRTSIFTHYNPPNESLNIFLYEYIDKKYREYLIIRDLNAKIRPHNKTSNINAFINGFTSFRTTLDKSSHSTLDYMVGTELFYKSLENFKRHKYSILSHHQNLLLVLIICTFCLENHQKIFEKPKNKTYIYERADWIGFKKSCDLKLEKINTSEDIVK